MSHEIRTPMNGLIGMVEVLEMMDPTEETTRTIETIRNSAFSLLRIINDILDASKMEAGELAIHNTRSELRPVIEGVAITLQTMADDLKVELRLYIDPNVPEWVLVDSGRLRQILSNILSNAIKFSASDLISASPEVYFHLEYINGTDLRVTVDDNGISISATVRDNLFKPFMQDEASSSRRVNGTGLGLAITANLLQRMAGDIQIASNKGPGTTVTIKLPMQSVDSPRTLIRIADLNLIWLSDHISSSPRHFHTYFPKSHVKFFYYQTNKDLSGIQLPTAKGTIYIMASSSDTISQGWQNLWRQQCN